MLKNNVFNDKKKTLLAQKEKLLQEIKYYEDRIDVPSRIQKNVYFDGYNSSDSEDDLPGSLITGPSILELKKRQMQLRTCLQATHELTRVSVLQSEVSLMVQDPVIEREKPVQEPGSWRKVTAECRIDHVPFSITFYTHQPSRVFAPSSYRGLKVLLVKKAHEAELSTSILSSVTNPSDAIEVLRSYAIAYRSRRTTLSRLADKYANSLFMEPLAEGGFLLKIANLLEMSWRLESKSSQLVPFRHRMSFELEYMDESYLKIIKQTYSQLSDPSLQTDERTVLLAKIISSCLEAQVSTQELYESMESDPESVKRLDKTTLDYDYDDYEPETKEKRQSDEPKRDEEVMAPPKSLPKKGKPKGKENVDNRMSARRSNSQVDGSNVKKASIDSENGPRRETKNDGGKIKENVTKQNSKEKFTEKQNLDEVPVKDQNVADKITKQNKNTENISAIQMNKQKEKVYGKQNLDVVAVKNQNTFSITTEKVPKQNKNTEEVTTKQMNKPKEKVPDEINKPKNTDKTAKTIEKAVNSDKMVLTLEKNKDVKATEDDGKLTKSNEHAKKINKTSKTGQITSTGVEKTTNQRKDNEKEITKSADNQKVQKPLKGNELSKTKSTKAGCNEIIADKKIATIDKNTDKKGQEGTNAKKDTNVASNKDGIKKSEQAKPKTTNETQKKNSQNKEIHEEIKPKTVKRKIDTPTEVEANAKKVNSGPSNATNSENTETITKKSVNRDTNSNTKGKTDANKKTDSSEVKKSEIAKKSTNSASNMKKNAISDTHSKKNINADAENSETQSRTGTEVNAKKNVDNQNGEALAKSSKTTVTAKNKEQERTDTKRDTEESSKFKHINDTETVKPKTFTKQINIAPVKHLATNKNIAAESQKLNKNNKIVNDKSKMIIKSLTHRKTLNKFADKANIKKNFKADVNSAREGNISKIPQKKLSPIYAAVLKQNPLRMSPRMSKFKSPSESNIQTNTLKPATIIPRLLKKPAPRSK